MSWVVYIVQAKSGKLYTGITNDLKRRLQAHEKKQKGAKFFHFSEVDQLVYQEAHPNRSEASKRESAIKKLTRTQKLNLISQQCGK